MRYEMQKCNSDFRVSPELDCCLRSPIGLVSWLIFGMVQSSRCDCQVSKVYLAAVGYQALVWCFLFPIALFHCNVWPAVRSVREVVGAVTVHAMRFITCTATNASLFLRRLRVQSRGGHRWILLSNYFFYYCCMRIPRIAGRSSAVRGT